MKANVIGAWKFRLNLKEVLLMYTSIYKFIQVTFWNKTGKIAKDILCSNFKNTIIIFSLVLIICLFLSGKCISNNSIIFYNNSKEHSSHCYLFFWRIKLIKVIVKSPLVTWVLIFFVQSIHYYWCVLEKSLWRRRI